MNEGKDTIEKFFFTSNLL